MLTPAETFISLSADFTTIAVDEAVLTQLIPASVKSQVFTLAVDSQIFAQSVSQQIYTFSVDVNCAVTEVRFAEGAILDTTFEVDPAIVEPMVIPLPNYTLIPCLTSVTHKRSLMVDSATLTNLPLFVSFSDSAGTISIKINNPTDTGEYKFKVVAVEPVSGLVNEEIKFTLTLTCTTRLFFNSEVNVNNVAYTVPADLNSEPVRLTLPVYKTSPDYCLLQPYALTL